MSAPVPPDYMSAFDGGDWSHYVAGHDPDELWVIDDPEELEFERLWMKPVKASHMADYGLSDDDPDDHVLRDRETGRFVARWCWVECSESSPGAHPFMGCKYRPADEVIPARSAGPEATDA